AVGPMRLCWEPKPAAKPGPDRQGQRRVDAAAKGAQDDHPPVAELVAEPLDDDPAIGRQRAGDLALLVEVGDEIARGQVVQVVCLLEPALEGAATPFAAGEIGLRV